MKNKKIKKGWALTRVSTEQQDIHRGSLEQQRNRINNWISRQNKTSKIRYQIIDSFEERTSGAQKNTSKRESLFRIRKAIENKEIDFLIVEKLDRLSRDDAFNIKLLRRANELGVEVIEAESGIINLNDKSIRMSIKFKNAFASEYSDELKDKITEKTRYAKVFNGKDNGTTVILGLDAHPKEAGFYVVNEDEKKIVIDIYKKFIELGSMNELVKYCEKKNYKTKVWWTKGGTKKGMRVDPQKRGGIAIGNRYLTTLLQNPKLRGFDKFLDDRDMFQELQDENGYVKWEYRHGRVIPESLTEQVDKIFKKKSHKERRFRKRTYLLSGLVYNSKTGDKFTGEAAKSGSNIYYTDRFSKIRIPKDKLEEVIIRRIKEYLQNSETIKAVFSHVLKNKYLGLPIIKENIQQCRAEIRTYQSRLQELTDALSEVLKSEKNLAEACQMLAKDRNLVEKKLAEVNSNLEKWLLKESSVRSQFSNNSVEEFLQKTMSSFDKKSDERKRTIIRTLIPKIEIDPDNWNEIFVFVRPDPANCHNGANVRLRRKWRERRVPSRPFLT